MRILLLLGVIFCIGCGASTPQSVQKVVQKVAEPQFLTARVVKSYPHDPKAYTQGLLYQGGKFYESLGEYGHSSVRRVDPLGGGVELERRNSVRHFGEGLASIGDSLYQLTWQQGEAFVYDITTLEQIARFTYKGEGWGLTSFAGELYMSDGTSTIRVLDPKTFRIKRLIEVHDNRGEVSMLNELEWIENKIWANVYLSPVLAVIDPVTGVVESYVDCTSVTRAIGNIDGADVLNGIAYDWIGKRIFVTGKLYDTLFQITY